MTVKELIKKIEKYPEATVCISMDRIFTDDVYLDHVGEKTILLIEN